MRIHIVGRQVPYYKEKSKNKSLLKTDALGKSARCDATLDTNRSSPGAGVSI
ncbi:hypothetical protein DPMN_077157 [Dreissena polymorpha]|uniref:Uncharacterized protein n=1 Tax=Dreissena polymorpha TaxID=45954 RepID=A0A9D4BR37_DREPO|nr:hypothetical protein DPMN_077157 [Dreissena polymorpha]